MTTYFKKLKKGLLFFLSPYLTMLIALVIGSVAFILNSIVGGLSETAAPYLLLVWCLGGSFLTGGIYMGIYPRFNIVLPIVLSIIFLLITSSILIAFEIHFIFISLYVLACFAGIYNSYLNVQEKIKLSESFKEFRSKSNTFINEDDEYADYYKGIIHLDKNHSDEDDDHHTHTLNK